MYSPMKKLGVYQREQIDYVRDIGRLITKFTTFPTAKLGGFITVLSG